MKSHYYNFSLIEKKDRHPDRIKAVFLQLLLAIAIIALPVKRADAQSPLLSYSSPQVYLPNTVITPLAPTGSGVAMPAYNTTPVTINTGLSSPYGVATDAAGNLYVSDLATKIVKEFPARGGTAVIIGSGEFSNPKGITVDATGNVYAAGDYNGHVTEILKSNGSAVNSGTGFNEFSDVAVDAVGNIYVADFGNNNPVKEILKSNGNTVPIGTGFSNYVIAVATDAAGNVYVADTHNAIKEILASNGTTIELGSGFINPQGVAVDAVGNVFVSDQGNGAIKEIPVGSNTPVTLVSGLTNPGQIAVDGAGDVYFVDTTTGGVQEITPVGGYYISALPPGLSFNNSTGVISGTTTAGNIPPTNYTVTAYNANGRATAVVNITVGTPPAPTLSYQSPQTYTTGAAIFPLTPLGTGVSPPAYSGVKITVGTGYNDDQAVATDAAGNIYVTDKYNNAVKKIPAGGGSQVTVASNLTGGLYGVAVDAAGNLYVSETTINTVLKIPAGGGPPVSIGSGFNGPDGLAVDAAGNVYVADVSNNAIKEILASDGSTVTLATGLGNGYGVAVDAAGNVYVAATYSNKVIKLPAGGGTPISIGSGFSTPESVAVNAVGNVYVSDFDSRSIKMIAAAGGTTTIATGFTYPQGLAVDGAGNVYLADAGTDVVDQVKPAGGYYLSSALPAGLSFNGTTGVISGTPSVVSAAKDYTVTAYNIAGSAKATVNLGVVAPVTITSITRQYAALTNTYYAAYTVIFSGPVTGLKPSNFSVTTTGGVTGTSINYITGSGNTYTVVVFTGTGDGTVTLNMANDLGVLPGVSTTLPFVGDTYTIDKTLPAITISNPSVTSTYSGPVTYTITYADANFNSSTLTNSNITVNSTGNAAAGPVLVSGSGTSYIVTLSSITGTGTLGISIAANTATDNAGNNAAAAGPSATFSVTPPPAPAISNSGTLTALGTTYGTASSTTSFTASGSNLTADVIVTAPAGFEVSTSASGNFGNTVTLSASGGSVNNTTIYVRLAAATTPGNYSGNVTLSSGATTVIVATLSSTVNQKALTVTLNNSPTISKVYDGSSNATLSAGNYNLNGVVTGDMVTATGTATYDNANAGVGKTVLVDSFVLAGAAKNNYTLTTISATTTGSISALPITVTANTQSKVYGTADPTLTYSVSPLLISGDHFTGALTRAAGENTGLYAITQGALTVNNNYTITYTGANLSITKASVTVTASAQSKIYGQPDPVLTYKITAGTLVGTDAFSGTLSRDAGENVGSYNIMQGTLILSDNYNLAYTGAKLSITQAAVTVTATAQTKVYGTADPALTYTVTHGSLVGTDAFSGILSRDAGENVGSYNITQGTLALNANYLLSYISAKLAVTAANLTVEADNKTKVYGSANPAFTITYSGFVNNDNSSKFTTLPVITTTALTGSDAGSYPITVSGAVIPNYNVTYTVGSLTVSKAQLTITADNKTRNYGQPNPGFTVTYNGFVNGDGAAKLTTAPTASVTATLTSPPGKYSINASGAASKNYSFSYVKGTLTIVASTNALLADLSIDPGKLSPDFTPATHDYTSTEEATVDHITVTPTPEETTATIKINGTPVANGSPSFNIPLNVGSNVMSVEVTAQDGTTQIEYTITIKRGAPVADVKPTNILTPNGDGKNDTWYIPDIQLFPDNYVKVFDRGGRQVYYKKSYNNDWDGTLSGNPLAAGTYYYIVYLGQGFSMIYGYITLLRDGN
jgi:gliding motility-associated-like protein